MVLRALPGDAGGTSNYVCLQALEVLPSSLVNIIAIEREG